MTDDSDALVLPSSQPPPVPASASITTVQVSIALTLRVRSDYSLSQLIGDITHLKSILDVVTASSQDYNISVNPPILGV